MYFRISLLNNATVIVYIAVFHALLMEDVIIFDYDGVIADSKEIFMKYFLEACKIYGVNVTTEEEFLRLYEGNIYESMLSMGLSREKILSVVYHMRKGLIENRDRIRIFSGMQEVLKALSSHPLFIVTSNDTEVVKEFLQSWNINFFKEILGSDREASKEKKIKSIMKKYPSSKHFFVGDTMGDIMEGKRAGARTVAATWGWHSEGELIKAEPDYIVKTPFELLQIFE